VFGSVVGHDRFKALLGRALQEGRLPPSLLFTGPDGVGKKTLALAAARGALCVRGAGDPCESCSACQRILRATAALDELRKRAEDEDEPALKNYRLHPDLVLAEPWRTGLKIDQVREVVRELQGRPFEARGRVVIVDDAHLMTEQAQNALLKSLEEPPPGSHVFLVTATPQGLLPTIRSRCQILRFGPLPVPTLAAHLERQLELPRDEARLRAVLAGGSLAAALAFESEPYRKLREELLALLESAPGLDALDRMDAAERLEESEKSRAGGDPLLILRSLLRDVAALRLGAGEEAALNADVAPRLHALARGPLGSRASQVAETASATRELLKGNAYKLLAMDLLVDAIAG
jgi:DNA polymerase-3 subunit delta'